MDGNNGGDAPTPCFVCGVYTEKTEDGSCKECGCSKDEAEKARKIWKFTDAHKNQTRTITTVFGEEKVLCCTCKEDLSMERGWNCFVHGLHGGLGKLWRFHDPRYKESEE